jgi:hypothetical protein
MAGKWFPFISYSPLAFGCFSPTGWVLWFEFLLYQACSPNFDASSPDKYCALLPARQANGDARSCEPHDTYRRCGIRHSLDGHSNSGILRDTSGLANSLRSRNSNSLSATSPATGQARQLCSRSVPASEADLRECGATWQGIHGNRSP